MEKLETDKRVLQQKLEQPDQPQITTGLVRLRPFYLDSLAMTRRFFGIVVAGLSSVVIARIPCASRSNGCSSSVVVVGVGVGVVTGHFVVDGRQRRHSRTGVRSASIELVGDVERGQSSLVAQCGSHSTAETRSGQTQARIGSHSRGASTEDGTTRSRRTRYQK